MTVLLHASDPHFGTEQPPVMQALLRFSRAQAPDVLVLSGDITQRARVAQFRAARAFVDALGVRTVLAIPGNHDIPLFNLAARLWWPYANHCQAFGTDLEPEFASPGLLVLTVNTTRPLRHKNGEVSAAQIARVAQRLAAAGTGQLRIVVTHQPVAVQHAQDEPDRLRGAGHAVRTWSRAGVDLILGGHIHLPFVQALHEQHADLPRKCWAVQAGTAVSTRVRADAGNSVNLIRCAEPCLGVRRATIERWDYTAASSAFERCAVDEVCADAG